MLLRVAVFLAVGAQAFCATSPTPLAAIFASASVPPGGTAQLQLLLAVPKALMSGGAVITLDPAVFDNITSADVYSATGDQVGTANITGRTVDVEFTSPTGGVGRVGSLPVLTITVPVLATAQIGAVSTPTFKTGTMAWADVEGVNYTVTLAGGVITAGGSLSVQSVTPLGSLLPAGSVVTIAGTGFTGGTTVQVDGVALGATQFVSGTQINLTLAGAADLEFHRVVVQNGNGSVAFFPALHGNYSGGPLSGALATIQPILPLQLYAAAQVASFANYPESAELAIQNPNTSPVNVTTVIDGPDNSTAAVTSFMIAAGGTYLQHADAAHFTTTYVLPSAPVRLATVLPTAYISYGSANMVSAYTVPPIQLAVMQQRAGSATSSLSWNANMGGPQPAPVVLEVTSGLPATFTASASTVTGGQWLSVSPAQGPACVGFAGAFCPAPSLVTVSVDTSKLSPGTYMGSATFTPGGFSAQPDVVPVVLNVFAAPQISAVSNGLNLVTQAGVSQLPFTLNVPVSSTADPTSFTVSASTQSGLPWLSVSPTQGQTPASIKVTLTASAVLGMADTGTLTITGPNNTVTLSVPAKVASAQVSPVYPKSFEFVAFGGQGNPPPQLVSTAGITPIVTAVQTLSGDNWLTVAVVSGASFFPTATVSVDATGLAAGTYLGSFNVSIGSGVQPTLVPVTLVVSAGKAPALTVSPAALSLTVPHGGTMNTGAVLNISTGNLPLPLNVSTSTTDGVNWLSANPALPPDNFLQPPAMTPDTVNVNIVTAQLTPVVDLLPGVYTGTITITVPTGSMNSVNIPVNLTVTPANPLPPSGTIPTVTAILNGASQSVGPLAPGEIVTIFGQNFGPATPAVSGGDQVLFDGISANVLYASATQINAVVPAGVSGSLTNVSVLFGGATIAAGSFAVAGSAPGIFTLDGSGQGAAAVLNQDGSVNSVANPAALGSVVQIFGTGAGANIPSALPVSVTIGGAAATVTYSGQAPGEVSGLLQVNAVVPMGSGTGSKVPILLAVGNNQSAGATTICVQ